MVPLVTPGQMDPVRNALSPRCPVKTLARKPSLRDNGTGATPAMVADRWQARQEACGWRGLLAGVNPRGHALCVWLNWQLPG
jgi:hypothetical protein